jgi:hypothetical protein
MRSAAFIAACASAALAITSPGRALAQSDAADIAAARSLGVEGFKLAAAGNCAEAVDKLARSEALHHAVSVLEKLGECQVSVGKLVDGTEALRRVTHEALPSNAPAAFIAAREQAAALLDATARRVAHLNIAVTGAPTAGAGVWVKVDGANVPTASLNVDRPVDPGAHVIEAGAPGFVATTVKMVSNEGATDPVKLVLVPAPVTVAVAAAPPTPLPAPPAPRIDDKSRADQATRSHTVAYVVGGAGLAGLAIGAISGVVALGDKSTLNGACHAGACPESASSALSGGKTAGTVSTVGFVVGGVGVAAGVVLYFLDLGGGATATARVGIGEVGLSGTF